MKFFISTLFTIGLLTTPSSSAEDLCLPYNEIDYNLEFLKNDSLIDKKSISNDFKNGVNCYTPPSYNKNGYVTTNFFVGDYKNKYENTINLGEQAFFFSNKIPKKSILYSHPSLLVLLFQEQFLTKNDISDYYISFEKTSNLLESDTLKTTYYSPYDFFKLSIQLIPSVSGDTIVYEFSSKNDINLLKNKIENYFLTNITKNNLPLKLENTEHVEVLRAYINQNLNSLSIIDPFVQIFLDHIDYNNLDFSSNTKMELIDKVYSDNKEANPFTIFGKDILISYTFDKENNKGLIAFSFLSNQNIIDRVREEFKSNH